VTDEEKMDIMIQQMKIMAKEENQNARKKWGNYGAGDYGNKGRTMVLPPRAQEVEALLVEGKNRREISRIMNISHQGVADYIARYNLSSGEDE
jgi:DNA-binding NarL/FixJ family response regulator